MWDLSHDDAAAIGWWRGSAGSAGRRFGVICGVGKVLRDVAQGVDADWGPRPGARALPWAWAGQRAQVHVPGVEPSQVRAASVPGSCDRRRWMA